MLVALANGMVTPAAVPRDRTRNLSSEAFHRRLTAYNHERFEPSLPEEGQNDDHELLRLEGEFVEVARKQVRARALGAPRAAHDFVRWFEALRENGPGQGDTLFPWLADAAPRPAMQWFLEQEVGGEAGFDDLVALTQIKMPAQAKLELARNYWDEMGQGRAGGMHGPMLGRLAELLCLNNDVRKVVWESLALGNLMLAFAANRRYAYHSVGALGVIELTAPGRAACVNAGLKRLGVSGEARRYFALHATLDIKHSEAWNREVLHPLVAERPDVATAIAEGALLRLQAGARCFRRYRAILGLNETSVERCA